MARIAVVTALLALVVGVVLSQDILVSPPKDDNTITWVGCASDDSNNVQMGIQDDISHIDFDFTAFTDIEISPCEGELLLKFGQQVGFGESTAVERDGAIRFNQNAEGTEDLEYRKNGEWVSLTYFAADSESKELPNTRIDSKLQRMFDVDIEIGVRTERPGYGLNYLYDAGYHGRSSNVYGKSLKPQYVPAADTYVTLLDGTTLFYCNPETDPNCDDSISVFFNETSFFASDLDIDSNGNPVITFYRNLGSGAIDSVIGYYSCDTPLCSSYTTTRIVETVLNPSNNTVASDLETATLPGGVSHTFYRDSEMNLFRMEDLTTAFLVYNNSYLDSNLFGAASYFIDRFDRKLFLQRVVASNDTAGVAADDYYYLAMVPLDASHPSVDPLIASFNEAVFKLLISHCNSAGCPDEGASPNYFIPNKLSDDLLFGSVDAATGFETSIPVALDGTIVDGALFVVTVVQREDHDAPSRELNQATYSLLAVLCSDGTCSDYDITLVMDSNDLEDLSYKSLNYALWQSTLTRFHEDRQPFTLVVEVSPVTGFAIIHLNTLTSPPVLITCHNAECSEAEVTVLHESLFPEREELRYFAITDQSILDLEMYMGMGLGMYTAMRRGIPSTSHPSDDFDPFEANPVALLPGMTHITLFSQQRLLVHGGAAFLGNNKTDCGGYGFSLNEDCEFGVQRSRILQFSGGVPSPDKTTLCDASHVGIFLNAAGRVYVCTRLPKKPLENNQGLSGAIVAGAKLYQWTPVGGNLNHFIADPVIANSWGSSHPVP